MLRRLFRLAIFVAIAAVLVYFVMQEQYQKPMKQAWKDVQRSEGWKTIKKTWEKAYKKTQLLIIKAQEGKLSEDIATSVDSTSRSYFGVGLSGLEVFLGNIDSRTVGSILFIAWLFIGYIFYKLTSTGTSFFVMAITLLVHSVYGQAWCLYQLCVLAGLGMYFVSLIANNAVIAAMVVLIVYVITTFIFFLGGRDGSIYRLEEKMDNVHYRTSMVEQKVSRMDKKLDKMMKKKNRSSSGGEE